MSGALFRKTQVSIFESHRKTGNKALKTAAAILSIITLPLVSSFSQASQSRNLGAFYTGHKETITGQKHRQNSCIFNANNNSILYLVNGEAMGFFLDMPRGIKIGNAISVSCQRERTIIVTQSHVVRALGYDDLASNREMLGVLSDGNLYPQNAIFFELGKLGGAKSAGALANILEISNPKGETYAIDVDNPAPRATPVENRAIGNYFKE